MKRFFIQTIFLCLLCCLLPLCACNKEKDYQANVYEYIPNYKNATCNILQDDNIELHIEYSVSDSKNEIKDMFDILQADYSELVKAFNLKTQIKCYVIADENILGSEKAIYQSGVLICNVDSINNESYRSALTAAYISSTERWKGYGAYAYAFKCGYNNEELKQYYSDGNDLNLTLFAAYFIDDFSDSVDIAKKTAYSFGDFIINNYGYDRFVTADLISYRAEYLKYLGVNREFYIPYDLSWLNGAEYCKKFLSYPLVIKTANRTYNLEAFSAKRDTASFDNPERVLYHLSSGYAECNKILNYIKDNAPESFSFVSKRYLGNLEYFISDNEIKTCCDVNSKKIYLLDPSEYIHETMHVITLQNNPAGEAWLGEGVAEYLSRYVSRHISDINNRFYLSFTDKTLTGSIADFVGAVNALYESRGGKFDSLADFDFALIAKCIGEITLKNSEYKSQIKFPYATNPIYKIYACTSEDGNVLTYPEAYAFTNFLIEKYGFNAVLKCCINYDLENAFGSAYSVLMDDFVNFIN